jgi:hypothetical protein
MSGPSAMRRVKNKLADPVGDPYFANVVSLLHFDGANGSPIITDVIPGRTWVTTGTALISTAQSVFGGSSLEMLNTAQNRIDCTSAAFNMGTGDATIQMRFRPNATANRAAFSFGTRLVYVASANWAYFNGANVITGGTVTANVFVEVCWQRSAGVVKLFVQGNQVGANFAEAGAINPGAMRIGYFNAGNPSGRYYDEFRATIGVARFTGNYIPDTGPYPDF